MNRYDLIEQNNVELVIIHTRRTFGYEYSLKSDPKFGT